MTRIGWNKNWNLLPDCTYRKDVKMTGTSWNEFWGIAPDDSGGPTCAECKKHIPECNCKPEPEPEKIPEPVIIKDEKETKQNDDSDKNEKTEN